MRIDVVGIDGDDTLWHSEGHFAVTEERFRDIISAWVDPDAASAALLDTERRNLRLFGYGVKGFMLSMIETAIQLSDRQVHASAIQEIIELGKALLDHPVELLDGVADAIDALAEHHRLVLVTKGDLFHQESKVAASGVAERFERIEIVAEKDAPTYLRVLGQMRSRPEQFCMIGNSVRSDIAPVLEIGGYGVHVPYHVTWAMEHATVDAEHPRLVTVAHIDEALTALAGFATDR